MRSDGGGAALRCPPASRSRQDGVNNNAADSNGKARRTAHAPPGRGEGGEVGGVVRARPPPPFDATEEVRQRGLQVPACPARGFRGAGLNPPSAGMAVPALRWRRPRGAPTPPEPPDEGRARAAAPQRPGAGSPGLMSP